jgi:hypothetical protein
MIAGWMAWAGVLAVLGLWVLGAYNRTTALRAAVLAGWTPLDAALQDRAQAVAALLQATAEPLAGEACLLYTSPSPRD